MRPSARTPRGMAYNRWWNMVDRCTNPANKDWRHYGGRGIGVCDAWLDFETYHADVGDCPAPGLTLDRRDNDLGYTPSNVRWATRLEQTRNRRHLGLAGHAKNNSEKTQCAHGHDFDESNTYIWRGKRSCRACNRINVAAYKARRRERVA